MPSPAQNRLNYIKPRALALVAVVLLIWAAYESPGAYQAVLESRRLSYRSKEVLGIVVGIEPKTGKNKCYSKALIEYSVGAELFRAVATGCSAAEDGTLRLGDQARVLYAPGAPHIADVTAIGVSTSRSGWSLIFVPWALALAATFATWRSFRLASSSRQNAA